MSKKQNKHPSQFQWRSALKNAGEKLSEHAMDDRAEFDFLIKRTRQVLRLIEVEYQNVMKQREETKP